MGALPQKELFKLESTRGDMVIPVDYNDGSAIDPGPDDSLWSQLAVDQLLAKNGATSFKHLESVYKAIPSLVYHQVTINLAAGIHRPLPDHAGEWVAWQLPLKKVMEETSSIEIIGAPGSSYTEIVASAAVASVTPAPDSAVDFVGTPFPGDNSLRGYYVIFDTGQVCVICEHTDSQLKLLSEVSPAPTSGFVGKPSTILLNTLDDVDPVGVYGALAVGVEGYGYPANDQYADMIISDIEMDPFKTYYGLMSYRHGDPQTGQLYLIRYLLDGARQYGDHGTTWTGPGYGKNLSIKECSHRGAGIVGGGKDAGTFGSSGNHSYCYIDTTYMGGMYDGPGSYSRGGQLALGSVWIEDYANHGIRMEHGCHVDLYGDYGGRWTVIRRGSWGITLRYGASCDLYHSTKVYFDEIAQSCLNVGDGCKVLMSTGKLADLKNLPGGVGNAGYGLQFSQYDVGNAHVSFTTSGVIGNRITISGALGDIIMSDNDIHAWSELDTEKGLVDLRWNTITKR